VLVSDDPARTQALRSHWEQALRSQWEAGRAAFPTLGLTAEAFVDFVGARLEPGQDPDKLAGVDLYLVAACLAGVPEAARTFIERHRAEVERHVRRLAGTPEATGELLQELWVELLTGGADGQPPRLSQYRGRGPLDAWLRVTIVRRGVDLTRKKKMVDFEEVAFDRAADHDPELSVLRRRHRDELAAIFKDAAAATPRDERTLLRMHYVDGATLNDLAVVFRTSRSGIHRKVEAARDALMGRIAALVRERLALADSQQGSLLGVFQSELREQLGRFLREP